MAKLERLLEHSKKCFTKQENRFDWLRFYRAMVYLSVYVRIGIRYLHHLEVVSQLDRGFFQSVYLEGILFVVCSPQLCDSFEVVRLLLN